MPSFTYTDDEPRTYPMPGVGEVAKGDVVEVDENPDELRFKEKTVKAKPADATP